MQDDPFIGQHISASPLVLIPKYPNTAYSVSTGVFYRVSERTGIIQDTIEPDELDRIRVRTSSGKYSNKVQHNLAWELANGRAIPDGHVVYFKNTDSQDIRGYNLGICTRKQFQQLRDAIENSGEVLKLIPHSTEAFSYKVRCKIDGFTKMVNFHDIIAAKRFMRIMQIKSSRVMSKYLITE